MTQVIRVPRDYSFSEAFFGTPSSQNTDMYDQTASDGDRPLGCRMTGGVALSYAFTGHSSLFAHKYNGVNAFDTVRYWVANKPNGDVYSCCSISVVDTDKVFVNYTAQSFPTWTSITCVDRVQYNYAANTLTRIGTDNLFSGTTGSPYGTGNKRVYTCQVGSNRVFYLHVPFMQTGDTGIVTYGWPSYMLTDFSGTVIKTWTTFPYNVSQAGYYRPLLLYLGPYALLSANTSGGQIYAYILTLNGTSDDVAVSSPFTTPAATDYSTNSLDTLSTGEPYRVFASASYSLYNQYGTIWAMDVTSTGVTMSPACPVIPAPDNQQVGSCYVTALDSERIALVGTYNRAKIWATMAKYKGGAWTTDGLLNLVPYMRVLGTSPWPGPIVSANSGISCAQISGMAYSAGNFWPMPVYTR